jgi:hypothetical protein
MRAARLAVHTARQARASLHRGDLEMAVRLVAATGTQVGLVMAAAASAPPYVTAHGVARSYMRASNVFALVVGEVAAVAGARCAVMVARVPGVRL